jgi:GMP synthase-like glutamine amidotransferase
MMMKINGGAGDVSLTFDAATVGTDPRLWRASAGTSNRVLVLQHRDEAPVEQLLGVLAERGLEPVVTHVGDRGRLPEPETLRIAMLLGADRFGDAADRVWLDAELDWLRRADAVGTPIFGIGHGARALASALGGGVEPISRGHRGWALVETSVPHVIPAGPWLSWQHDVIRLPTNAQLLAHNLLGPQAFTIGRHLGVQFHPEASPAEVEPWSTRGGDGLDFHDTLTTTTRDPAAAQSCARRLFSAFINTV